MNINKFILYICTISITFYTAKLTSYSPIYLIYMFMFPFMIMCVLKKRYIAYSADVVVVFFLLIYILSTQFNYILTGPFINLFIALIGYIYIRIIKNKLEEKTLIKIIENMTRISIILLILDSVYRLMNPGVPNPEQFEYISNSERIWFYMYKFNTLMFADSNTTALIALILLFSTLSLEQYINTKSYKYEKFFLFLIIVFAISRSAYIGLFIGLLFFYYKNLKLVYKMIYVFFTIVIVVYISLLLSFYLENDGSFNSKFHIISLVLSKINFFSLSDFLFGIGMDQSSSFLGISTHILLLTYFIETGLIGLLIFSIFISIYLYKYNGIILTPILISSLSYFLYLGTPFLFIPLALIANLIDLRNKGKYIENR